MEMKYKNSPIMEAVCEFRLRTETGWDLTIPGLVYEKIDTQRFPHKEQRTVRQVRITTKDTGIEQQVESLLMVRFLTEDRKTFIQVGPDLLAVNRLAPYSSWEDFLPDIRHAYDALTNAVSISALQRIGLRYINGIDVPEEILDLEEYFEFRPHLGGGLPQNISTFSLRCAIPYADHEVCGVSLSAAPPSVPGYQTVFLDIDHWVDEAASVLPDQALAWIEKAHTRVELVFEGCITDKLREVFGRNEPSV